MLKRILSSTSLKVNLTSNFLGNVGSAVLGMLFLPFYLRYVGAEAYGLIGVFGSLQSILFLLDSGLGYTLNKELAVLSVQEGKSSEMNSLLKTFEFFYWGLGLLVFLVAFMLSLFIASHWINPGNLSHTEVVKSFYLLSVAMLFQFPLSLYTGGLLGLQRHFSLNFVKIFFALLKGVGAIVILKYISSSVTTFFLWNMIVTFLNAFFMRWALWKYMPATLEKPAFVLGQLKSKWRFAAGMSGIGITAMLLTQLDKIILSKVLSLKDFGYYSIATTIGLIIYQFIVPVSLSYFPRFSALVGKGEELSLKTTYHQGSQLISTIIFPVTFMLCFFSKEFLTMWLKDPAVVEQTWLVVSIYSFGTALNGLIHLPFMLTLSYGRPKLFFYGNLSMLLFMIPGIIGGVYFFGVIGAASCWVVLNIVNIILMPLVVHNRMLKGEARTWYWQDTLIPMLASLVIVLSARWLFSFEHMSIIVKLICFSLIGLVALGAAIAVTKQRNIVLKFFRVN
ncbi:MAG: oligosaccharide flippase family protein [Bacteroidota bacterium]